MGALKNKEEDRPGKRDQRPGLLALEQLRGFLRECWEWSHHVHYETGFRRSEPKPEMASTFMCRHTAKFLLEVLEPIDAGWRLAGGDMATNDGRKPQSHWWIENDDTIIDLTADQFGWDEIHIGPADDLRYVRQTHACHNKWINGLGTVVDQWKGQASRDWMENHPQFQAIAARWEDVIRDFGEQWKCASDERNPTDKSADTTQQQFRARGP